MKCMFWQKNGTALSQRHRNKKFLKYMGQVVCLYLKRIFKPMVMTNLTLISFKWLFLIILLLDNGPLWHWFLLNILPLDNDFQYRFLTKTSLKERLKQIKRIVLVLLSPLDRSILSSNSDQSLANQSLTQAKKNPNTNNDNINNN